MGHITTLYVIILYEALHLIRFLSDHRQESANILKIMSQLAEHVSVATVPIDRLEDARETSRCMHVVAVRARNLRPFFTQASPYSAQHL